MIKKVLFICVHNSGRSQMAETLLNNLGKGDFFAESAGFDPAPINPLVIDVMQEWGYDLSDHQSKDVFTFFRQGRLFDYVITVCDKSREAECPIFPGIVKRLHWTFNDPAEVVGNDSEKLEQVRKIRDAIRQKVANFINESIKT